MGLGLIALGFAVQFSPAPRLVWNVSASAPRGFYLVSPTSTVRRGDLILATLPDEPRRMASERGYLPSGVPILKRVAAVGGTRICADEESVHLGNLSVPRLIADRQNRPLPTWTGCRRLGMDEVFLLMANVPDSFDSRYFGPVTADRIIGKARPLWTE